MDISENTRWSTELQLMKLSHDFAYCMDYMRYEELVQLFTPDALLDRILHVHRGHAEILAGLQARPTQIVTRHVSTNFHYSHVDDNTAKGVVYNISYFGPLNATADLPVLYGSPQGMLLEFHDVYRRTGQRWLFSQRIARPVLLPQDSPMFKAKTWRASEIAG